MESLWWIREIDWRVSSGIIFFILLLLWGRGEKRDHYALRCMGSFAALAGGSFCLRYALEVLLRSAVASSIGYSISIMVMSLLFLLCFRFCCKTSGSDFLFSSTVALTVYRIAWDVNKVITVGLVQLDLPWSVPAGNPWQSLSAYVLYALVSFVCYLCYRRVASQPCLLPQRNTLLMYLIVLLVQMIMELAYRLVQPADGSSAMFLFFFTSLMYSLMSFAMLLMFRHMEQLQQDNEHMESFIKSKREYYEISREGILSLQTKCHDLKHQIKLIRSAEGQRQFDQYVERLEESIDEYNTVVETGNKSLDVVLTEKNIICLSKGIKFSYIIDGTLFNFLMEMDIYALFGNIMDNAIESMNDAKNRDRCFISMKAAKRSGMVVLYVENYFENELKYERGHLVTNKTERQHHGFGLRSIMAIAEQHGGMASFQAEDQEFRLTVTLKEDPSCPQA